MLDRGLLAPPALKVVALHILSALDYLESKGICHRDVKPDNILYQLDGKGGYIFQLADFGLANYVHRTRTRCGTEIFMAPEVFHGERLQTPKVDVWSLGVSIISLGSKGAFPQNKDLQRAEVLEKIRTAANDEPMVRRMTHENPDLRASAAQILLHYFNGEGLTTPLERIPPLPELVSSPPEQQPTTLPKARVKAEAIGRSDEMSF